MQPDSQALRELIQRCAAGDHAAFAQVYQRTRVHLFGVAHRMLGGEQAAEDVLQEAFVSVWKNAASYRAQVAGQELQPMTWLIAIVRNKALDALRQRARRGETPLDDAPPDEGVAAEPSALELLDRAVQALQIGACLEELGGSHRQSLALAYYQGLSHTEIAARMGAPLGSVKAWIRRGLDRLRDCLRAREGRA